MLLQKARKIKKKKQRTKTIPPPSPLPRRMRAIRNLILTGCGTSLNAANYGAKLMRDYEAFDTAIAMDSAETKKNDLPRNHGGVVAISQSGETKDVHRAVLVCVYVVCVYVM